MAFRGWIVEVSICRGHSSVFVLFVFSVSAICFSVFVVKVLNDWWMNELVCR